MGDGGAVCVERIDWWLWEHRLWKNAQEAKKIWGMAGGYDVCEKISRYPDP